MWNYCGGDGAKVCAQPFGINEKPHHSVIARAILFQLRRQWSFVFCRFLNNPRGPDWNVGNFTWSSSNASPIVFVSSAATAPMTPLMESFVREMVEEAGFAFANLNPLIPLIEHQSRIEDQSGITQSENTKTRSFNSLPLSWLNDATLLAPLFNLIQQEIAALPENFIADENDGGNSEFSVQKSLFVGKLVFQLLHHPSSPFTSRHRVRDDALPAQSPASTATPPPIQGTAFLMLQKLYWRSFDSWIAQQVNFFSFHCRNCLQSVEYWSQFTCLIHDMERTSLTNENNRDSISANAFVGTGTWEPISIPVTSPQPTDDNSTHGVDAADVRSIDRHLLPSHPSAWITTTLHHIASSIHAHFSSQLDRAYIMDKLIFRLGQEMVLSFYESFAVDLQTLSTSETVQHTLACKWSDKALLQILFDFGYLCSVFCVNDGKTETLRSPPLNPAVSSLSATLSPHDNSTLSPHKTATITPSELPRCVGDVLRQLQSVIDPIDYSLLRPFINANIGRALSRVDLLLSVLLDCVDRQRSGDAFASINSSPFATSAPVIAPPSTASSFLTEQHNIIPMFPSPSRFILLPTGQQQQSTSLAPTSPITSSFPSHSPSQRQSFHRVHRKSSTSSPRIDSSATTLPAITKSLFSPTIQVSTRSRRLSRGHLSSELSPAPSKLSGHHQINFLRVHKASHGENTKLPDSSHSFSPIIPTLASSSNVSSNNPLTSISSSIQSRLGILGSYF